MRFTTEEVRPCASQRSTACTRQVVCQQRAPLCPSSGAASESLRACAPPRCSDERRGGAGCGHAHRDLHRSARGGKHVCPAPRRCATRYAPRVTCVAAPGPKCPRRTMDGTPARPTPHAPRPTPPDHGRRARRADGACRRAGRRRVGAVGPAVGPRDLRAPSPPLHPPSIGRAPRPAAPTPAVARATAPSPYRGRMPRAPRRRPPPPRRPPPSRRPRRRAALRLAACCARRAAPPPRRRRDRAAPRRGPAGGPGRRRIAGRWGTCITPGEGGGRRGGGGGRGRGCASRRRWQRRRRGGRAGAAARVGAPADWGGAVCARARGRGERARAEAKARGGRRTPRGKRCGSAALRRCSRMGSSHT